jgi:hypothetical protein
VTTTLAPAPPVTQRTAAVSFEPNPELMHRLPFQLPDFTRITWATDAARGVWEPRLRRITNAWIEIEWLAIVAGVRSCCITVATPEQFLERGPQWAQLGLNALPVEVQGVSSSGYSATNVRTELGRPFAFRFVLGAPDNVCAFKAAWDRSDDRAIGQLLGYPACCREFFKRTWVDQALVDTTWPMAVASAPPEGEGQTVEVNSVPQNNILWRWMGARAVSHLPCSFACGPTLSLADRFLEVGRQNGFGEEMDWLLEVLSWPVEWSALHGIAEIKTPVLKVSTRTDATPCKYTVRYQGRSYPAEGAQGLRFPYRRPALPLLTESLGFKRGLGNPIGAGKTAPPWYAADNGFTTIAAMDAAQTPILKIANAFLAATPGSVLDLGCGNGALLKKLHDANPAIIPFGVESEPDRIAHARELLPAFAQNFVRGDMYNTDDWGASGRRYTLALFMPGRLLEAGPAKAARLRAWLKQNCDHLLVYAYGDWLTRQGPSGNLKTLVGEAGLELLGDEETAGLAAEGAAGLAKVP